MTHLSSTFKLTATSLAVTLMLAACGGGDAEPPPDLIPPTVAITDSVDAAVATGDVTFTFAFSESVGSSFVADDVTVAGGSKGAFTMAADGLSATLVVVPTADSSGTLSVNVAGGAFSDTSGNASTVAFSAAQDYNTVVAPPPPPPPTGGVVLASFDESPALAFEGFNGAEGSSIAAGPDGATGLTAKILRMGGEVWAGAFVNVGPITLSATANTISARVYSDLAGVPMVLKLENAADAGINTGDLTAQQAVVQGWQTLTWVIPADKLGGAYNRVVMLPNLGTLASADPGETYYFDDITVVGGSEPPPPPPTDGLVLASFDESPALAFEGFNGAEGSSIAAGPDGATGLTAKILRMGGEVWAGAFVNVGPITLSATANTISARVYSDLAGVPMVLKLENAADAGINTGDLVAQQAVVQGWQTLTWVIPADKLGGAYNRVVMLPNLGTLASADPGETYYFDDIKLLGGTTGGGGGGDVTVLTYSSGFASFDRTLEGGAHGGFSGSNQDGFACKFDPAICGNGGEFSPAVPAADSYFFNYYQTAVPATALYSGVFVLAPGITALNDFADTAGVSITNQTKLNITVGQNAEWFNSTTKNFLISMDLGKLYSLGGGTNCRLQVRAVVTPTAVEARYSVPLSAFSLVQNCGGVASSATQAFAQSPVSQINVQANGGTIALEAGGKLSGANLTVPTTEGLYPTTIVIKGGITFD